MATQAIDIPDGFARAGWGVGRARVATILAFVASVIGIVFLVTEVVGAIQHPSDPDVTPFALLIILVAGLVIGCFFTRWSRRVRFQLDLLEAAFPGASVWKAWGYPANATSLAQVKEDARFFARHVIGRSRLFAVFAEDSLTLWRRNGKQLDLMASIPRDGLRYVDRDWRRPVFIFSIHGVDGREFPFPLGLSRGRFRGGIRDSDAASTVAAHWGHG